MIAVAPGYIVFVVNFADTRIITILSGQDLLVSALEFDRFIFDLPVDTVFTSSNEDVHADGTAVAAEYTYVSVLERYDCAVEDTVGTFLLVTADDRVLIIAPYRHVLSCWFLLPGHIRQIVSDDFTHLMFPPVKIVFLFSFSLVTAYGHFDLSIRYFYLRPFLSKSQVFLFTFM